MPRPKAKLYRSRRRTPAQNVARATRNLAVLRRRLTPILYHVDMHNISKDDQFYGFGLLDALKDDLSVIEQQLTHIAVSLTPPRSKPTTKTDPDPDPRFL